jgi:ABC-type molybdate transport system substrate-binding protein
MKKLFSCLLLISGFLLGLKAQDHRFDPPWNIPPESKIMFTIPGIDNVPDLYGDVNDPELVIFFAGNQFMVVDDLLAGFKKAYPKYRRIFAETLPPGILAKQIDSGSLTIGNMRITIKADVYTAGRSMITQMTGYFTDTATYAYNKLAIMVPKGNPKKINGLADLGRKEIRVSMPNPLWEGIGRQIEQAYVKAGGESLRKMIMESKVNDGTTYLTQIHHRQTPMRILYNQSDAGPVWISEAYYQQIIHNPIEMVSIPDNQNITVAYMAAVLKTAPHLQAAKDFLNFMQSATAKSVYKKYGFETD